MTEGVGVKKVEGTSNQKLTARVRQAVAKPGSVRPEGVYYVPQDKNSFGIPSVDTCPGRTEYCERDCYAIDTERRSRIAAKLQRNSDALGFCGEPLSTDEMASMLGDMIADYLKEADKLGITPEERFYRIHWSGDFFSVEYAQAWRKVIEDNPDLPFYAYTRSFQENVNVVPILAGIPNLDLFMSVDYQNVDRAAEVLAQVTDGVKVAYLADYKYQAQALVDKLGRQDVIKKACPENMRTKDGRRKLPLISDQGGACFRCGYCINKPDNYDVIFVKKGLNDRSQYQPQPEMDFDGWIDLGEMDRPVKIRLPQKVGGAAVEGSLQEPLF